jgi:polysaccharide biosynthesis transport protein
MDLIYFFKVLFRKKWIILGLALLAVIATFFFKMSKQDLYVSQAQYSTGFTAEKVRMIDGSSGIDIYTADVKFNNVIETFKSPRVINTIGYKLLLHDLQNPAKAYRKLTEKQMKSPLYKAVNKDTAMRAVQNAILTNTLLSSNTEKERVLVEYFELYGYNYDALMGGLVIERVGRTDYLDISFYSENPELSSVVVNSMGQEFINYYRSISSQRTEEGAESIKKIVTDQQNRIDSLGEKLLSEKKKQGSIDPVSLSTSAMEAVKELETALASEKSKQNEHLNRKQYLTARLNELTGGATSAPTNSGGGAEEVIRLTNKKNDLVAELAKKGGSDPVLEKQISDLRADIAKATRASSGASRNPNKDKDINDLRLQIAEEDALYRAASSTIADYTSRISKYSGMATSAPVGSDVIISGIQSRIDLENAALGNAMGKLNQAVGLVKDDPTANFIQTGVGQPAIGPESKKTLLTMIVAGMSMFFLASVIFLLIEVFDPRVKTPSLFKKQVKLNLVNTLNKVPLKEASEQEIVQRDYEGKKYNRELFFKNNVKKLRFELLKGPDKIYLFTSTQKGSGKSTIIDALATSLVMSDKKVLIVDLNFANNSITRKYTPEILIQNLAGKISLETPLSNQKAWSKTPVEGLSVIGCEPATLTPSEVLHNIDLAGFFAKLKEQFDYVLIEGAALNDVVDSQEIAVYSDAVFTIFSANNAITPADEKSIRFIFSLGSKNKGTVLNNVLKDNLDF